MRPAFPPHVEGRGPEPYARRVVLYHSYEWDCLVEQGWVTDTVDLHPEAGMIAVMVRPAWRAWN